MTLYTKITVYVEALDDLSNIEILDRQRARESEKNQMYSDKSSAMLSFHVITSNYIEVDQLVELSFAIINPVMQVDKLIVQPNGLSVLFMFFCMILSDKIIWFCL